MNWYKLSQFSNVEVVENHDERYSSIGHGDVFETRKKEYYKKNPNYLWYFFNGDIISEKETIENSSHLSTFSGYNTSDYFGGRFESATGKLSVNRPYKDRDISQYRPVPESILYKLYQKFPGVKQIYMF